MEVGLEVVLAPVTDAGREARRHVERCFAECMGARALEDLRIVVSELVNNAVVHGRGDIALSAALVQDAVRVVVKDAGEGRVPAIRERAEGDGGGWGLRIVEHVALRWGATEQGKVWADLPTV